ncbi:MAG: beta strand repeat-containing protein, partial [Planctomycetota bacterium]
TKNLLADVTMMTSDDAVDLATGAIVSDDGTQGLTIAAGTGTVSLASVGQGGAANALSDLGVSGGTINLGGVITTAGGNVSLTSSGDIAVTSDINSNGGTVSITAGDNATIASGATVAAGAGNVSVRVDNADDSADTLAILGVITSTGTVTMTGSSVNANDVLQGSNNGDTWVADGANTGTLEGWDFNDFALLQGGSAADNFTFLADYTGTVHGGAGDDQFNLTASQSGLIDGGAGTGDVINGTAAANVFVVSAANGGTANGMTFANVENLNGGAAADVFTFTGVLTGTAAGLGGDDSFTLNVGGSVTSIAGGTDNDTIIGNDGGNAFVVNAANTGTANGLAFSGIENLTGGAAADTFNFTVNDDGGLTTVDGAAGDDEVSYAGAAGPVTVAIDRFTNIETLNGSGNAGDTLQGTGNADAFMVSGANSGVAGTISFSGFENLDGLGGNDTFTLAAGGSVSSIDGGADSDTVVGNAGGNAFVINAANSGTVNGLAFSGIENLTGGAAADTFAFGAAGSLAGSIAGGGDSDELDVSAPADVTVNLGDSSATILNGGGANGFSGIETFTGNGTNDTLVGTSSADTFATTGIDDGTVAGVTYTDFVNLSGGAGNDIFNLNEDVTGSVNGGDDADVFNLTAGVSIGGSISGGTDDDELVIVGGDGPNTWAVTADDAGTLNGQAFSDIENLTGNVNVDNFNIIAVVSGTVSGMGGDDVFNLG